MKLHRSSVALALATALVLGACGGSGSGASETTPPASEPATSRTISTTTTAPETTTTPAAAAKCPEPNLIPSSATELGNIVADDGSEAQTFFVAPGVSHALRITHPDGTILELARNVGGEATALVPIGFYDVNSDGIDELFVKYGEDRVWIVVQQDCELSIASAPELLIGAPIAGGGDSLLVATIEANDVSAGIACNEGMMTIHYYFIDPSPSMAGKVKVDVSTIELEGDKLLGEQDSFVEMSTEDAAVQLVPLNCGSLVLP